MLEHVPVLYMKYIVKQKRNTKEDKIGQYDHRNTADQVDKYQCKSTTELIFHHTHYTDNQAYDAGKEKSVQCEQQRLSHGGDKYPSVSAEKINQGETSSFRIKIQ